MNEDLQIGGHVCHFLPFWFRICKDRNVINMLKGVRVPFIDNKPPIQHHIPPELCMSTKEMQFVDNELQELLCEGFIKKLNKKIPNGWVSNILVPKKNSGYRMILNL